jgi:hypothetical protein
MTLPSTGPLSLNDIRIELDASVRDQSLRAFSDTAGFTTPDAISEFYGYSNLKVFSYNSAGNDTRSGEEIVCSLESCEDAAYHNGSGDTPVVGDMVYSDSSGTTPLLAGYFYKFIDSEEDPFYLRISATTAGEVGVIGSC